MAALFLYQIGTLTSSQVKRVSPLKLKYEVLHWPSRHKKYWSSLLSSAFFSALSRLLIVTKLTPTASFPHTGHFAFVFGAPLLQLQLLPQVDIDVILSQIRQQHSYAVTINNQKSIPCLKLNLLTIFEGITD